MLLHTSARLPIDGWWGLISLMVSLDAAVLTMARPAEPAGEDWDAEDERETRHRLPRLAALFLGL
jgi:hypothetical protein